MAGRLEGVARNAGGSPARELSAADMDAALDDEFDDLLGSSDSDASDA